jgi:hypothetical protein
MGTSRPRIHTLVSFVSLISLVALLSACKGGAPVTEPDLELAHKQCIHNREQIAKSEVCGCFHCLAVFAPTEIKEWVDNDDTALCPKCGIDSVLGSASSFPINKEFLRKMKVRWFD